MTTYTYKQLYAASPCTDGLTWLKDCEARGLTLAEAWDECSRSDWMFWALEQLNIRISAEQDLRLQVEMLQTPLADGLVVEDLLADERSRAFVALKRKRLSGEVVDESPRDAAGVAAWDAAWDAARDAARSAAWAAAWEAARAAAGAAAEAAARTAALAAAWEAAGTAAGTAALDEAWTWQADKLRETIENPFAEE